MPLPEVMSDDVVMPTSVLPAVLEMDEMLHVDDPTVAEPPVADNAGLSETVML